MAEQTRCPVTRPKLEALAADASAASDLYRTEVFVKRKSVHDLLEEFPACELSFSSYLEMLPLLAPRYYSISSSPALDSHRCSITVGVVEGPARSGRGIYKGVCSNHLANRQEGDEINASIRQTKAGFRLPDTSVPIIMIGPGTGLAPFRGFLQERAARKAKGATLGSAMLFFGCRHPELDFLYAQELKQFAQDGICDLHVAFSRAGEEKTYVQDLIRREGSKVNAAIASGAIIYVCGDGGRMEPEVKSALIEVHRSANSCDEVAARAWMEEMGTQQRYVLDVWAGD
jgi:cytochrome P450/NADPH-cytochrome P450 reductase